jgi:hypothetical protein
MKTFLGNFVYADFNKKFVILTDEDGSGHVLNSIALDKDQWLKLKAAVDGNDNPHSCVLPRRNHP